MRPVSEIEPGEVAEALRSRRTVLPFGPRRLNLCFDRSCNLACPSCRPTVTVADEKEREEGLLLLDTIRREAGPGAVELTVSGYGDPFASPSYRALLEEFRPEDFPRIERLHLHTNGQLWDEATWRSLPAIHPFVRSAEISVDAACAETYTVNRPGGDFERLLNNLDFLQTLPLHVTLSFVVQQNNYREIPAFVDLGRRHGFSLYFSLLVNWGTFSSDEYRARAVHLPDHPEHRLLCETLGRVVGVPDVDLGNLAPLLTGGGQERNSR